jgi:hypothetical protein
VLPLLHAAGVRNVVVFADEAELGAALDDRGLRAVGRSYHVVSTRLGPGAFHPKLILLTGEEGMRACISSANLTVDGQLRNVESAIVLDSREAGHKAALAAAASFVRAVAEATQTPPHTLDALLAALPETSTNDDLPPPSVRLVHNLDELLLGQFPQGALTATSPYTDTGAAASALANRGSLTLITDGDAFAAPASFFAGSWTIVPRKFLPRRLHAKAYWSEEWLLVGSPNLSARALLETAGSGNTELGVILSGDHTAFTDALPGEEWSERPLSELAPHRHELERRADRERERVGSFDAWEDDGEIAVSGIEDLPLEHWNAQLEQWEEIGQLVKGRLTPPSETRPHLVRGTDAGGRIRQAIVHRTRVLRSQREQPKAPSRGAQAVTKLPLDLHGVKALEDVLRDLYALESLRGEPSPAAPAPAGKAHEQGGEPPEETLTEWRPARDDDEPRIPELYRRAWKGEPDTLLALIRKALRLDEPQRPEDETEQLGEESPGEEGAGEEGGAGGEVQPEPAKPEPPRTTASVLARYRGELIKLLGRGADFVRGADSAALADLAFVAVLRLHEELVRTEVIADEESQPLVEPHALLEQKVTLLDAYLLDRGGRDPSCFATARAHAGLCLTQREHLSPLAWETLERIAYRCGADLLAANPHAERAARDAAVEPGDLELLIRPYAERADWGGFIVFAEAELGDVDCGDEPYPWVAGAGRFNTTTLSPAWRVVGYGAIAGFAHRQRYGVHIRNKNADAPHAAHALVVDPAQKQLHEAFRRKTDGRWLMRTYSPVSEHKVAKTAEMGPDWLLDGDTDRSGWLELERADDAPALLELLRAVGEVAPVASAAP